MENRVTVYTMKYCPYCTRAKQLLTKREVPFEEVMVEEEDDAQWDALYRRSGMKTMPQIFAGEKLIGGFEDLLRQDQRDELKSLKT